MKEQELDKYIGKFVKITDFANDINYGTLYKIKDGIVNRRGQEEFMNISNGYFLECWTKNIIYRKSHIKKIEIIN